MILYEDTVAGIEYYKQLPEGWIPAKSNDFFKLKDKVITPKVGMKFILHGYYDNRFEIYKVSEMFKLEDIEYWINDKRCFIQGEIPIYEKAREIIIDI